MAIRMDAANELLYYTTGVSKPYTMMAWVRMVTDRAADSYLFQHILNGGGSSHMLFDSTRKIVVRDSNNNRTTGTTVVGVGEWHHVAFVVDTNMTGYLDGGQEATRAAQTYTPDEMDFGGASSFFNGRMAAIKCWAAALTQDEIVNEMRTIRPQRLADLSTWYPMISQTLADNYIDLSGNARTLTLYGGTLTVEDGPPVGWGSPSEFLKRHAEKTGVWQSASYNSGTSGSVNKPTGVAAGDLVVLWCRKDENDAITCTETGFQRFLSVSGPDRVSSYSSGWWKILDGGEGSSFGFTWTTSTNAAEFAAFAYSGVNLTSAFVDVQADVAGGNSSTPTYPSVTLPTGIGHLVLDIVMVQTGGAQKDYTGKSSIARGVQGNACHVGDEVWHTSGSTGTRQSTDVGGADNWSTWTVAFKLSDIGEVLYDHDGTKPWASLWRAVRY